MDHHFRNPSKSPFSVSSKTSPVIFLTLHHSGNHPAFRQAIFSSSAFSMVTSFVPILPIEKIGIRPSLKPLPRSRHLLVVASPTVSPVRNRQYYQGNHYQKMPRSWKRFK